GDAVPPVRDGAATPQITWWIPGSPISGIGTCPAGTTTALKWTVPAFGGTAPYYFCLTNVTLSTNFGVQYSIYTNQQHLATVTEYSGPVSLLTAIVLPNGQMWRFAYNSYGEVQKVTLPTGGSISYSYITYPSLCSEFPTAVNR